ncbi:hypothetical protein ACHAWO_012998 [Cyclotella atomus]|uniref:Uncharacterized protein n=1 Tax=Cyclotella atomus TaxID=382360 RepID=A0ABD3NH54_9STRA
MSSNPPQANTPSKKRKTTEPHDIPAELNLTPGTRLQVKWTICDDDDDEAAEEETSAKPSSPKSIQVWWTATLQPKTPSFHTLTPETKDEMDLFDQGDVTLTIYELDYDPLPSMDFHERSIEQVAFVSEKTLLNLSTDELMIYRKEGEESPPPSPVPSEEEGERYVNPSEISELMDGIIQKSMDKLMPRMNGLPMDVRQKIAEKLKRSKEKLYEGLMGEMERVGGGGGERVVTGEVVRRVIREMK